ncbi:MAG: hypothetical protein H6719_30195 [Sandaracinaceae bacterium]|nr:hypothetical protein [Sandaracinaceae bacterium]
MARIIASTLALVFGIACTGEPPPPVFDVVDRLEGDRTPRAARCDDIEPTRCLLPWPSNTYTVADPTTETGLRLDVDMRALNPRDDATSLALADGFSRVSPLLAVFEAPLAEETLRAGIHLFLVEPGHPDRYAEVPLRVETITNQDDPQTLLLADPMQVLEADADYLVVITRDMVFADGSALQPTRGTSLALGLAEPASEDEAAIVGYHAPSRQSLSALAIEPTTVVRLWDFTTRSEANGRAALVHMRERSIAAVSTATAVIDRVQFPDDERIALVAVGRLQGLPTWLDGDQGFTADADGLPMERGTTEAPFRVVVPAGEGDYRFVMYGHGTGGNELDDAFDGDLAGEGIAKVNLRFYGWTDTDVLLTFSNLQQMAIGSFGAAAYLAEAVAHGAAIQRAVTGGVIADLLAAPTIAGMDNPVAGRHPDGSHPMWVGGSLGGTMGLVYAAADPEIQHAVINVPGAAWSQWVWHSVTFDIIHGLLGLRYGDDVDLATALSIGQTNLDMADGAAWFDQLAEHPTAFLVQESIGDPVLPNPGTEMVAVTTGSVQVGGVLVPIEGVPTTSEEVVDASAITQFQAPPGDMFDVHGFAARGSMAGVAAREQILRFVTTALFEGHSVIAPPPSCPAAGCDFGGI